MFMYIRLQWLQMGKMNCPIQLVFIVALCSIHTGLSSHYKQLNTTEFNSCSCDMTSGNCDVYCCCDQDCSEILRKSFTCKDEIQVSKQQTSWKCSNLEYHRSISTILCIEKENNPVIGLYYENFQTVHDIPSMNYLLNKKSILLNLKFKDKLSIGNIKLKSTSERGYVYGQTLNVIKKNRQTAEFCIPYSIYDTTCDFSHPVQYLKDISSVCTFQIQDNCFDEQMKTETFLLGKDGMDILGSLNDESPLDDIKIHYFKSEDVCCYMNSQKCANIGCKRIDLIPYISTGSKLPSLVNKTCKDALLEVQYIFLWTGNQIKTIDVTMVLGDITITDGVISQRFSTSFRHVSGLNSKLSVFKNGTLSHIGYSAKDPVLALLKMDSELQDSNETLFESHFFYWRSDVQGACVLNDVPVLFGVDTFSGCWYHIDDWDTIDCSEFREDVMKMQSTVMAADFISRSRAADFKERNFLEIIIRDDNVTNDSISQEEKFACPNIPQHMHLEIVYSEVYRTVYGPVFTIVSAVRSVSLATFRREYGKKSSNYPIYSSVKFRYLSVEDEDRRKRAKRSELPLLKSWQVSEASGWNDILYPFACIDFRVYSLDHGIDVFYLVILFIASSAFLLRMNGSFHRSSAERP